MLKFVMLLKAKHLMTNTYTRTRRANFL